MPGGDLGLERFAEGNLRLGIFYPFFGELSPGSFYRPTHDDLDAFRLLANCVTLPRLGTRGGPPHGRQNWVLYWEAGHTAAGRGGLSTGGGGIGLGGSSIGGRRCGS